MDGNHLPLSGVKVVELGQVVACPFPAMLLGDLGAEVVKIEAPKRGDRARATEPRPAYFDTQNRNKRSIELNLKHEDGQEVAHRLLEDADMFLVSTKPGRTDDYNLDYDTIAEINPELIYVEISGWGSGSPYENVPAWDMLMQAMSGVMSITGEEGGPPVWSGLPSGDLAASMYSLYAGITALYARERGDIEGEYIEIPMLDCAISWLTARAGHAFGTGEPYPRMERHATMAPFGPYECADETIVIAAGTDSLFEDLCISLDSPELAEDERFETMPKRLENREEMIETINGILAERSADEWIDRMHANEVPAARIYDTKNVWEDPHVKQRGLKQVMEREGREDATVIDNPVLFENLVTELSIAPEELGESTEDVLTDLGYSEDEIESLSENDVV